MGTGSRYRSELRYQSSCEVHFLRTLSLLLFFLVVGTAVMESRSCAEAVGGGTAE